MNQKEKEMDKRNRLMAAAETVFSRRGFAQATLDEIIALADTGKGTLYKYYGNKDDLFYTLVSRKHGELMERMWSVANDNTKGIEDLLVGVLSVWTDFLRKNTILWQVLCFEMTCTNRGFSGVEDENGEVRLITRWGKLPSASEQENILRYHRLLAEEMKPITQVYAEGIRRNFFNEVAKHKDIARHMFLSLAMLIFFHTASHLDEIPAEELAANFVRKRLYGLAEKKK